MPPQDQPAIEGAECVLPIVAIQTQTSLEQQPILNGNCAYIVEILFATGICVGCKIPLTCSLLLILLLYRLFALTKDNRNT